MQEGNVIIKVYAELLRIGYYEELVVSVNRKLDYYDLKYECDQRRFEALYVYVIWKIEPKSIIKLDYIYSYLKKILYKHYLKWDFIIEINTKEKGV